MSQEWPIKKMEQEEAEAKGAILGGCLWVGEEERKKQI